MYSVVVFDSSDLAASAAVHIYAADRLVLMRVREHASHVFTSALSRLTTVLLRSVMSVDVNCTDCSRVEFELLRAPHLILHVVRGPSMIRITEQLARAVKHTETRRRSISHFRRLRCPRNGSLIYLGVFRIRVLAEFHGRVGNFLHWRVRVLFDRLLIFWCPLREYVLQECHCVLRLYLLPLNHVRQHVLVPLDQDARISLAMNQLLVAISLDPLHERIYLKLLVLFQFFFLSFNFHIDLLLMLLNFQYLKLICLLTERVRFHVLFHEEVSALLVTQLAAFLR